VIDLHTHSTASDGTLTPTELVELALRIGLEAMALTDHDTVDGVAEALAAAAGTHLLLVPGVELSAAMEGGTLHIVGLFLDPACEELDAGLARVMTMRNDRNPRIVARLAELGLPVSTEEAAAASGTDVVGRPHFAQVMVSKGYVRDVNEAFDRYLGRGGEAHVHKDRLEPAEAIRLIRAAGGVPILAHPDQTGLKGDGLDALVEELKGMGLAGIEVFCSPYKTNMTHEYSRLARRHGLVRSGGTDFHGAPKPRIKLGRGFGSLFVHRDLLAPIREAAEAIRAGAGG
jgi:predicted metal-dependent phosphoesterase TrpH